MTRDDWERRIAWLRRILGVSYLPQIRRDQLESDLDWLLFVEAIGLIPQVSEGTTS